MRIIASLAALALLSGCQTLGGGAQIVSLQTDPPGALVVIDGAGQCETPCTVKLDGPKKARIAKAGFVTQYLTLSPGKREIVVPLELAAASEDVDETELPELQ